MKYLLIVAIVACVHADVSHVVGIHSSFGSVPKYPQNPSKITPKIVPKSSHVVTNSGTDDGSIVRNDYHIDPEGSFQYRYETSNGIVAQAEGVVKNANTENAELEVRGNVQYVSAEGIPVSYSYVANGDGYQPEGDHLPVGPAPPAWLARALDYINAHPHKEAVVVNALRKNDFGKF